MQAADESSTMARDEVATQGPSVLLDFNCSLDRELLGILRDCCCDCDFRVSPCPCAAAASAGFASEFALLLLLMLLHGTRDSAGRDPSAASALLGMV